MNHGRDSDRPVLVSRSVKRWVLSCIHRFNTCHTRDRDSASERDRCRSSPVANFPSWRGRPADETWTKSNIGVKRPCCSGHDLATQASRGPDLGAARSRDWDRAGLQVSVVPLLFPGLVHVTCRSQQYCLRYVSDQVDNNVKHRGNSQSVIGTRSRWQGAARQYRECHLCGTEVLIVVDVHRVCAHPAEGILACVKCCCCWPNIGGLVACIREEASPSSGRSVANRLEPLCPPSALLNISLMRMFA